MRSESYITSKWTNGTKTVSLVRRTQLEVTETGDFEKEDFFLSGHLTPATGFFPSSLNIMFNFLKANGYYQLPGLTIRVHQFTKR